MGTGSALQSQSLVNRILIFGVALDSLIKENIIIIKYNIRTYLIAKCSSGYRGRAKGLQPSLPALNAILFNTKMSCSPPLALRLRLTLK